MRDVYIVEAVRSPLGRAARIRGRGQALGLQPRARVVDTTIVGVDPVTMLKGSIPATRMSSSGRAVATV